MTYVNDTLREEGGILIHDPAVHFSILKKSVENACFGEETVKTTNLYITLCKYLTGDCGRRAVR